MLKIDFYRNGRIDKKFAMSRCRIDEVVRQLPLRADRQFRDDVIPELRFSDKDQPLALATRRRPTRTVAVPQVGKAGESQLRFAEINSPNRKKMERRNGIEIAAGKLLFIKRL